MQILNAKNATKHKRVEATMLNSWLPISKPEICYVLPDVGQRPMKPNFQQTSKTMLPIQKVVPARARDASKNYTNHY